MCLPVCTDKLGVESGTILDANFETSHYIDGDDNYLPPYKARLHGSSAWRVPKSIPNPWIQADIGYATNVSGLLTQGNGAHQWITKLKVSTFTAAVDSEVFIKDEDDDDKVILFESRFEKILKE